MSVRPISLIFLLNWIIGISASAVQFQPILQQISSGNSYCSNEKTLRNFDLSEVTQFGAMCNIPVPDKQQVEFLLENNVVPILCMGLFDVSERLCKSALEDSLPLSDILPPTPDKFQKLFKTLNENDDFSLLDKFCSRTISNYTVSKAVSNVTKFWWSVLNNQFDDEMKCKSICRTYDNNKVHPLCSFIIWANGIYKNRQNNKLESEVTATVSEGDDKNVGKNLNIKRIGLPPVPEGEPYRPLTDFDTQAAFQPAKIDIYSTISTITWQRPQNSGDIPDAKQSKPSSTDLSAQKAGTDPAAGAFLEPMAAEKVVTQTQNKSLELQLPSKASDSNPPGVSAVEDHIEDAAQKNSLDDAKLTKTNKPKKKYMKKRPFANKTTNYPGSPIMNEKTAVGNIDVTNRTESVDQVKPKTDFAEGKADDKANVKNNDAVMVEGDFSFEPTQEALEFDQPIAADKDIQPPYPGEEDVGDGDDVNLPEEMIKSDSNKTSSAKLGSNPLSDQGGEPDKVYSDGEVEREILIEDHFIEAEDSHFFSYFLFMAVLTILVYLAFHNKKKLVALAVEGRRSKGARRRPNCSNYSKLDCSLEEALTSNTTASVTHVLY